MVFFTICFITWKYWWNNQNVLVQWENNRNFFVIWVENNSHWLSNLGLILCKKKMFTEQYLCNSQSWKKLKNSSDWYLNTFDICKVREMSLYWFCQTIKEQENKENKSITNINEIFACHRHLVYENEINNFNRFMTSKMQAKEYRTYINCLFQTHYITQRIRVKYFEYLSEWKLFH